MNELIESYRGYVPLGECDEMGHMNIQHYVGKSEEALAGLALMLGLPTIPLCRERHIRFHRELIASDLVTVACGLTRDAAGHAVLLQEVREALKGRLAATQLLHLEDQGLSDLAPLMSGAGLPLPDEAAPRSLPSEAMDRRPVWAQAEAEGKVTHRSIVNAEECLADGPLSKRALMRRVSDAQGHMWALAGLGRHEQMAEGLATATVEVRVVYLADSKAGDGLTVFTHLQPSGSKTLTYRHLFFDTATRKPRAVVAGTGLLFDRETRRAIALPDRILNPA